jgi:hypothetical protein
MNEQVRLTAEWTIDAEHVAVKYRVTNGGADPVYVIDGTFRAGPAGAATWDDRLQIVFRPPDTAVLGSRLTPLDPRVHYAFPPHTLAVRVAAGESHESTLTAPLPLVPDGTTTTPVPEAVVIGGKVVRTHAGDPPPLADKPVVCRVAEFELGVIPNADELRAQPARLADRDLFRLEKAAWSLQQIVTAERRPVELPMLVPAASLEPARP